MAEADRGAALEIIEEQGELVRVKLGDARTGWVLKDSTTTTELATGEARLSGNSAV